MLREDCTTGARDGVVAAAGFGGTTTGLRSGAGFGATTGSAAGTGAGGGSSTSSGAGSGSGTGTGSGDFVSDILRDQDEGGAEGDLASWRGGHSRWAAASSFAESPVFWDCTLSLRPELPVKVSDCRFGVCSNRPIRFATLALGRSSGRGLHVRSIRGSTLFRRDTDIGGRELRYKLVGGKVLLPPFIDHRA